MEEDNKVKYDCDKCNFKCKFESQWKKHIDTELHKTGIKKTRSDTKEPYKCDKCLYETKYHNSSVNCFSIFERESCPFLTNKRKF